MPQHGEHHESLGGHLTVSSVRTRHATASDLTAVHDLYQRCSPRALEHRFPMPVGRVPVLSVHRLLEPAGGLGAVQSYVDGMVEIDIPLPAASTHLHRPA